MTKVPKELQEAMGVGMEDIDMESMPILKILQKTGAELDDTHKDYAMKQVPNAKAGNLFFLSESHLFGDEMEVIPLSQTTLYAEWRPKTAGGGIVGHHQRVIVDHDDYRKGTGQDKHKEYLGNNELKLTIYFFVLVNVAGEWKKAILPCASSNLKHGRGMQKQIRGFRYEDPTLKPSIYSRTFKVRTQIERGHGNSWFEYDILPGRVLSVETDKDLILDCYHSREDAIATLPQPTKVPQLEAQPVEAADGEEVPF
jgi:hypothetical protein